MTLCCPTLALPSLVFASIVALGQPTQAPPPLAIEHVVVLPMTIDGSVLHDQTVTLRDGRIAGIEASLGAKIGAGVRRVDGTGKYLMPSLTDAHVHLENDRILRMFLQNPNIPTGTIRTEDIFLPYVPVKIVAFRTPCTFLRAVSKASMLTPCCSLTSMKASSPSPNALWSTAAPNPRITPAFVNLLTRSATAFGLRSTLAPSSLKLALPCLESVLRMTRSRSSRVKGDGDFGSWEDCIPHL